MWSTASFDAPYVLVGRVGASSRIGTDSGSPYVAAVEEKTIRRQSTACMASSRASDPPTLVSQYSCGRCCETPTSDLAATARVLGHQRRWVVEDGGLVPVGQQGGRHYAADVAGS